jgi:hypothetical protein
MKGLVLAVGVAFALGNGAWFKDAAWRPPSADLNPAASIPGGVNDLRVSAVTDTSVVLSWTEVSSGTTGIARYVIRYGPLTFTWGTSLDVLTGGCGAPVYGSTALGGRVRSCVLGGLAPKRAYRFQLVAYTGTLATTANFGPLSNVVDATTAERIGPMLVQRPAMFLDTLAIAEASLPYDFGPRRYPIHGRFPAGDRVASFYDSTGALIAWGYLLVVRP